MSIYDIKNTLLRRIALIAVLPFILAYFISVCTFTAIGSAIVGLVEDVLDTLVVARRIVPLVRECWARR